VERLPMAAQSVVGVKALRQRWRANVDTVLLFGVLSLIIAEGWAVREFSIRPNALLTSAVSSLLITLPYLLLRLVDDFDGVPRPVLSLATVGLAIAVAGLVLVRSPQPL